MSKLTNEALDDKFGLAMLAFYCVLAAIVILICTATHADPLSRSTVQRDAPTTRF